MNKILLVILLCLCPSINRLFGQVVINEVMINAGNCDGSCVPNTGEWTELYNNSSSPIDISCYVLTDGDWAATIPPGTILGPHSFYVIGSNNSVATIDLDIGMCNCTSIGSSGDGNIGVFTNGDEQLVISDFGGNIVDGIYWGAGQFSQTPNITTDAILGCPAITINLSSSQPQMTNLSGSGSDQTTIALDCDGIGPWNISVNPPNPGSFNANTVVFNHNPTITPQSCAILGSISLNPTGGIGPFSYAWQGILLGNNTNTANNLIAGNYSVEVTDLGQCAPPALFNINVPNNNTPSLAINAASTSICLGQSVTLTATGGLNYTWNASPDLNNTSGNIVIATPTLTSTYTVQSSNNGCNETQSITIQVDNPINVVINNNTPICSGDIVSLSTPNIVGANYSWSGPNGFNSNIPNPIINNANLSNQGLYQLTVTLGACNANGSSDVIIDNPTSSNLNSIPPICIGSAPIDLVADNEPGIWSGIAVTNSATGIFDPSFANIGVNIVSFDSDAYCTAPTTMSITVNDLADATILPIGSLCSSDGSITLSVVQSGGNWSGNAVNSLGVVSPNILGPGIFTAQYSIAGQCGDTDAITVEVFASPAPLIEATAINGCAPVLGLFLNNASAANENCVWTIDGSAVPGNCSGLNYLFSEYGCHDVSISSTNADGCTAYHTLNDIVCVDNPPTAAFEWSPLTPTLSDNIVTFHNLSMNQSEQIWNINGFETADLDVIYTVPSTITEPFLACIEVTSPYGCQDSTCYTIAVDNDILIYIPNAFTPNNDDINNGFGPSIYGIQPEDLQYEFLIFNRWGDCIFRSQDPLEKWDGDVHDGDYYGMSNIYEWQLQIGPKWDAEVQSLKGTISLLR